MRTGCAGFSFVNSITSRHNECCDALKNKFPVVEMLIEQLNKSDEIKEVVWIETNEEYSEK